MLRLTLNEFGNVHPCALAATPEKSKWKNGFGDDSFAGMANGCKKVNENSL
jgi:hypothetical protein